MLPVGKVKTYSYSREFRQNINPLNNLNTSKHATIYRKSHHCQRPGVSKSLLLLQYIFIHKDYHSCAKGSVILIISTLWWCKSKCLSLKENSLFRGQMGVPSKCNKHIVIRKKIWSRSLSHPFALKVNEIHCPCPFHIQKCMRFLMV